MSIQVYSNKAHEEGTENKEGLVSGRGPVCHREDLGLQNLIP